MTEPADVTPTEPTPEKAAEKPFNQKVKKARKKGYKARYHTASDVIKVKYTPNGPQKKFADMIPTRKITLFVGGRQGGKTYSGARETLKHIYKYNRKPNLGWIISPTYPMSCVVEREFENAAGWYENGGLILKKLASQRAYLLHPPAGQDVPFRIEIKTAENPDRLRGAGLGFIWMDEAAMMSEEVYKILLGTILATKGVIFMTSTPRGHNWFYKLFMQAPENDGKNPMIGAVKGKSTDNEYLGAEELLLMKGQLSADFARQELDADFVSFDGLVYRGFNYTKHVIPTLLQLPPGSEVVCGIDNGYGDPFCCLWVAKHDGKFYVIDEYYEKGRTLDAVSRTIRSKSWDRHAIRRWADPSGAQERAELDKFGISTYPARNDIFSGVNCVERLFETGRLYVAQNCINTIAELGQYHYKNDGQVNNNEKPVDAFNHAMDALRYAIFSESEFAMAHPFITIRDDGSMAIDRGQGSYMTADINEWAGYQSFPVAEFEDQG